MTPDACRPVEVTVDGQTTPVDGTLIRLPGHGLQHEGAAHDADGRYLGRQRSGHARCACGELSGVLPSTAARQRWHREHKAELVQAAPDGAS